MHTFQEAWGWVFSYFLMTHPAHFSPGHLGHSFYLSLVLPTALAYFFKSAYNLTQGNK